MNKKLDPGLRSKLRTKQAAGAAAATVPKTRSRAKGEQVGVIVGFTGNVNDLTAIGFVQHTLVRHPRKGYSIATGVIAIDRLDDLAAIPHVTTVEGPRRMHRELNFSLKEIRATDVHTGTLSRKGKGVVVGIIDSGIDWRHGSFVDANGKSRILAIWDQMLPFRAGDTRGPNNIGVVYNQDQLTQALKGRARVRTKDVDANNNREGHGTHVAGIAAGNGRPPTCCHVSQTYVGVAPEAELIVVRYDYTDDEEIGENQRLIEAIDFIFGFLGSIDKPKVINISQGDNLGPHDGTSAVELAIDAHVETGDFLHHPQIVVKSAGNEGGMLRHVQGRVSGNGSLEVEFEMPKERRSDALLDLWYDRAGTLNLTVTAPGGAASTVVNHGTDLPANAAAPPFIANPAARPNRQTRVSIDGTINGEHDRNNNFRITIARSRRGHLLHGPWKLTLANPNAADVDFHCWIERGTNTPWFLPPKTPDDGKVRASLDATLSIPGTAAQVITVANHASRTSRCDCWPSTGIVSSSSRGPVARGAATNHKPDIAAPGLEITSAKADAANLRGRCCDCCPDACCCLYEDLTGTSMAAPHVAGAIALLLEENPRLTRADIVRHLQTTARERPAGGWDATWGGGKLNIQAAIDAVRAAAAGGGGGGGVPRIHPPSGLDELLVRERKASAFTGNAAPLTSWLRTLRERLQDYPEGEHVAAAISRHFSEARRLINSNRRIATMWHRAGGPALLRRLIHGNRAIDGSLPIEKESASRYLDRCLDLLARQGSPRLRQSLDRYHLVVSMLLTESFTAPIESRTMSQP
ncbi:MAG: S8 family serine peptidase [Rhodocyclaceae bacterium]|nr:S8 family serine peptidase [Rhodocyclaceae bacterium]